MAHMNEPTSLISCNNSDLPHQALLSSDEFFEGAQTIHSTGSHSNEIAKHTAWFLYIFDILERDY